MNAALASITVYLLKCPLGAVTVRVTGSYFPPTASHVRLSSFNKYTVRFSRFASEYLDVSIADTSKVTSIGLLKLFTCSAPTNALNSITGMLANGSALLGLVTTAFSTTSAASLIVCPAASGPKVSASIVKAVWSISIFRPEISLSLTSVRISEGREVFSL
ncbi:hypothetical protein D3C80_1576410 [compost metagenome]